ncbi:MAG: ABC transporter ATP-binding protein, partial [Clostridia bacterium]|nr:ABC transporter ATP-binding protein [Clostridia bacterium]
MTMLEVQNVSKSFGAKRVLDNVFLHLEKGELVSLLGVSGGGKTTLFNIIAGLLKPDGGRVLLHGRDITGQT